VYLSKNGKVDYDRKEKGLLNNVIGHDVEFYNIVRDKKCVRKLEAITI